MKLIAKKPCSFEGKKFYIGDEIPAEYVANPKSMEKMGVIVIAGDNDFVVGNMGPEAIIPPDKLQQCIAQVGEVKFEIFVHAEESDLPLQLTNADLSVFMDIQQLDVRKTEDKQTISDMIQKVESNDLLIALDAIDGRKFVSDEARARAEALTPEEEPEGEQGGDE